MENYPSTEIAACRNCSTTLGPEDHYFSKCGGKIIRNRSSIRSLLQHINETYFNYDNKLLRTFRDLFSRPEDVMVGYIRG